MLLSHTVLLELYQEKLVTEDDVERMKSRGVDLLDRLVNDHCTKPPEVVTEMTDTLDRFGHDVVAVRMRGW